MKKFSISTQLLILVFTILLFTSSIFMVATYFTSYHTAEDQVYARLEMHTLYQDPNKPNMTNPSVSNDFEDKNGSKDMTIYTYIAIKDFVSNRDEEAFNNIFTQAEFESLISSIKENANEESNNVKDKRFEKERVYDETGKIKTKKKKKIYYYCRYHVQQDAYIFAYTDNTFANSFIKASFLASFAIFIGMLFLAVAVIYGWSAVVTRRLRAIQNHLIDLPKNRYEKAYVDNALDEIGELSRSVEVMREEIGNNEKTKQEMLQNLSHDFKTPIAVIKSYAEAYQDGMAGPEAVNTIIEQAEILKKKVNRLLQYNSLEYLTKDKPFEDINMTELVQMVVTNYKFQTDIKFNLLLDENIIFQGYRENWATVVENIIDNATRYAKEEIKIELKPDYLRIYNDGEAIDPQFLNSVFKPYEKGSKGQFGLGMSIVMKTVNFFGFNMTVKNEDEKGVSFIIKKQG